MRIISIFFMFLVISGLSHTPFSFAEEAIQNEKLQVADKNETATKKKEEPAQKEAKKNEKDQEGEGDAGDEEAAGTKNRFEQLELFNKIMYLIENQYYREVDSEKLIEGAIRGMIETLDPHSSFLDKDVFAKMQADTAGEFGGLGIEVTQKDGAIVIITPIDDTPAFKAGVKSGDKIVEIDHESTLGLTLENAVKKMKGKPGTKIQLGVYRDGFEGIKYFEINREIIKIKPVKFALVDNQFAHIRLTQFQKRSAESIREALSKLKDQVKKSGGLKGIILDLRSNPGGLLDQAVEVSSIFLNEGVVVSTEGRDPSKKEVHFVTKTGEKETTLPLAVLINGASASASEIVAGALQDHKRGLILGMRSFGKGSVQSVAKVDEEAGIKLTIAQYMTPNNRKIQAIGIVPDIEIPEYDYDTVKNSQKQRKYIRESDLRNHLSAAIETAQELKDREEKEKKERQERIQEIEAKKAKKLTDGKNKNKNKNSSEEEEEVEEMVKTYDPSKDFQVIQAINYLKSFDSYKAILKK